jgi:hypothetical protein
MQIQVGMLVSSWGLSQGWNNVTDEGSVLESRTEQWFFSWMDWQFRMSLGKVVELYSHAKQALVWNRATVVCILWLVEVNWSVDGQRGFMYYVSSDCHLAANGHTCWMHVIVFMTWNCSFFSATKMETHLALYSIVLRGVKLSEHESDMSLPFSISVECESHISSLHYVIVMWYWIQNGTYLFNYLFLDCVQYKKWKSSANSNNQWFEK